MADTPNQSGSLPEQVNTVVQEGGWKITSATAGNAPEKVEQVAQELKPADAQKPDKEPGEQPESVEKPTEKPAEPSAPAKPKIKLSDRVKELRAEADRQTWRRREAERQAAALEQQIAARKAELESFNRPQQPPARPADKPSSDVKPGEAQPGTAVAGLPPKPKLADFKKWDDFDAARDEWYGKLAEARAKDASEAAIRHTNERFDQFARSQQVDHERAEYSGKLAAVKARHADWDEVIEKNLSDPKKAPVTPFLRAVILHDPEVMYHLATHSEELKVLQHLEPTRPVMDALRASTQPAALLSYFAAHRDEFDKITRMAPPMQFLALGRLEARLEGAQNNGSPTQASEQKKPSPPHQPVGGTRRSAGSAPVNPDELPFGPDYVKQANKAYGTRGRR